MLANQRTFSSLVAVLLLAACMGSAPNDPDASGNGGNGTGGGGTGGGGSSGGGSGGGGDPPPPQTALFVATAEERATYETVFLPALGTTATASVMGGTITDFSALPLSGSMTYEGYLEIIVGSSAAYANVAAPATLTLTLLDLGITGTATGFMGSALDENLEEQLVNYAGTIVISEGQVSAGPIGNAAVALDIDGALDSGLHVFDVDGTLVGSLYGTGGEGLRVRASTTSIDGDFAATVDGATALIGSGTLSALLTSTTP